MAIPPSQTRFGCYIGNIDRSVTIDMLKEVFCQCGTIIDCSLNGREGDPYRFGFIDFATEDDRGRAMKYNGFTLVGRKLKVGVSKGNVNKPDGFSNGNPGGIGSYGHHSDRQRGGGNGGGYRGNDMGGGGGMGGGLNANGLSTQQQIEARLLLQFLQEGKMDPHQLSPAQQQLLIASLGQANNAGSMPGQQSPQQQQQPPMSSNTMMGGMMAGGGMGGAPMHAMNANPMSSSSSPMGMGRGGAGARPMMDSMRYDSNNSGMMGQQQRSPQPWAGGMPPMNSSSNNAGMYATNSSNPMMPRQTATPPQQLPPQQQQQPPYVGAAPGVLSGNNSSASLHGRGANPAPTPDMLRLREKQREQFFDVVRRDTEKYERKQQAKKAQAAEGGGAGGTGAERSDSSASDDDEKPQKKSRKEGTSSSSK